MKSQKNKVKQPYAFTGREWDREAGLYYYRARYYEPNVGRFVTRDPFSLSQAIILKQHPFSSSLTIWVLMLVIREPLLQNKYVYSSDNPVNYTDPYGLINWGKVGTGIVTQLAGWGTFYGGAAVTALGIAEAMYGFPLGLHAIAPGGTMISMGGFLIYEGGTFIYEGFADYEKPKDSICPRN